MGIRRALHMKFTAIVFPQLAEKGYILLVMNQTHWSLAALVDG